MELRQELRKSLQTYLLKGQVLFGSFTLYLLSIFFIIIIKMIRCVRAYDTSQMMETWFGLSRPTNITCQSLDLTPSPPFVYEWSLVNTCPMLSKLNVKMHIYMVRIKTQQFVPLIFKAQNVKQSLPFFGYIFIKLFYFYLFVYCKFEIVLIIVCQLCFQLFFATNHRIYEVEDFLFKFFLDNSY